MASTLPRKKGDQVTTFASDVDTAENAPEGLHDRKPTAKSETVDSNARTLGGTLADLWARGVAALKETETKPTQFREDARIWQLYLEEAEEKAQDKAEIWKTGLDSLLIYAGLFASVVSSFVIDVRSDLQPDREPRLLSDILDFLRTASTDNAPGIPSSAYRIHGLWIVSLFTTIFSAIMGVLAKAWLAKYTPAKNRGKATDAYRRYKLDRESERWYLKEVLILAPLFVQIASVLFLAGLILQALGDNPSTGQALLGLCIATGLGYFYVTFLPLFIPSSPFNTPLSELLRALYTRKSDGEDRPAFESDIDDGLGEILYHKLVMSGKSLLIDGAVAEVALPGFDPKWTNFLCKNETPHIVLARFEECATSRTISAAQRDEILGNHLLALLSFTELYHANLKMANRDLEANDGELTKATATLDDLGSYRGLDVALQNALEHGRPLHSWNDLPDAVRPLLFALRANVLLTLPKSTSTGYTVSSRQTPSDFNDSELTDRPWEMTFRDTLPGHRIHFTLAACCGLVQGEKNLKQISSFILCLCLAKASFMASETGRTSEWASTLTADKHDGVRTLTLRYLSRLYEATGWEDMVADALREISSIETPVGLGDEGGMGELASGVPRLLLLSLSQPNHSMRAHAFKMLTTWICTASSGPSHTPASLKSISTSDLQCIADIAIFDDQAMQDNGLALLVELTRAADEDMVERVKDALVVSIRSGLMKHEDPATQIATMNFIEKLSRTARDRVAVPVIADAILALDNLFRNFPAESVRQATRVLFQGLRLSDHTALTDALKAAILEHLIKIFGAKRGISALNEFLGELVTVIEQDRFETDEGRPPWTYPWNNRLDLIHGLGGMFGSLVEAAIGAYDSIDGDISDSALSALKLLSTRISFKEHMELDVLRWLEPIASPSDSWRARYNAVAVVAIFSKEMDVSPTLLHLLVKTALKDDDSDVRFVSLELASNLFQGNSIATDTADTVKQLIINEFDIEKDSYKRLEPREEEKWLTFIHDISQCAPFPEAIPIIIQTAMNGAAHSDSFDFISQAVAVLISDEFARDSSEFQVLGKCQPPELAAVLPPPEPQSLSQAARWVRLLIGLLARTELRAMVMHVLQGVVTSVRGTAYMHTASEDDAATPASEIANESKQGPTASQARALELLRGCDADERVHWVEIFSMISEISTKDFPDAPDLLIEIILHFDDSEIQSAVLKSLLSLGRQDSTSDGLRNSVLLNVDRMSATYDWEVRAALPRLLTGLGVSTDVKSRLDEKSLTVLKAMALEDGDYDVRSETIVFLSSLSSVNEGEYLFQSDLGTGDRDVKEMALQLFDKGIVDGHHLPRQSWLKFAVSHINEASSSRVTSIFNVAIQDSNSSVRKEASNALYRLLSDTNLRDSFASRLGKDIAIAIKDREHIASAISLLVWLTSTKPKDEVMKDDTHPVQTIDHDYKLYPLDGLDSTLSGGHDAWVRLVMLLGRYGLDFQGVPILVEAAMKDKAGKTFRDLGAAFGKVKLLDQIQAELPGYLHRALSETKSNTRLEAVNFLASLLCAESGDSLILGDPNDVHPIIMSRLADISVKDDDSRLRNRSLKLLRSLLTADRFRDTIGSCWCKSIEACLSGQETWKYRTNAIRILSELTDTDFVSPALVRVRSIPVTRSGSSEANNGSLSGESSILRGPFSSGALAKAIRSANPREGSEFDKAYKTLNRIILPSIPILLRITLVSDKEPGENLREVAEDILLKKLKVYHGGMRLNEEVLSMIPSMIPTITTDGKRIALRIIETLQVSDDKALSVAHALVPLLRNPSSFSRAIAVELLSGLYRKYRLSKPRMIESSIQEVIALALDEKDNVGEIRRTAVQLLAALSEPLEVTDGPASAKAPVVRPTIQLATQFMVLLQNEDLRPSVVELLSLMATQVAVRSAISVQIMASSFMPDGTLIQGHTELLARLISDGRFADETTDKVMLFLASTMITRPKLARYRFEILTALWCRYATKGIAPYRVKRVTLPFSGQADTAPPRVDFYLKPVDSDKSTQQLVDWFNFAMFGRHASVYEVEKYLTKSALCLPKLTVDSAEVTKCTVKEERISTARTSPLTLTDA